MWQQKKIVERTVPDIPGVLHESLGPELARIYASRGAKDALAVELPIKRMLPPKDLQGIDDAVALLADAMEADANILVVADYDADGATSAAVAQLGLNALGAQHVAYLVPNRFEFGYGLTPEIVELAVPLAPELIVTVDNGIASVDGVATANEQGISVLITDHHLPGDQLPMADAIVNPNLPGDRFASKNLAGVGVIFYVLAALRAELRGRGWFKFRDLAEPQLATLLDLVATGTVADLVALDQNNRVMVRYGLQRIRQGQCRPGILALLEQAGRDYRTVTATDLGFYVGPRLNAAGRLQDMSIGIECLLTDDTDKARELAGQLDTINRERREIESDMQEQALQAVAKWEVADADLPNGVCLMDETWHPGVVGLVASRIRERVDRPVIAFAPGGGGELRGSARSIPGFHIRDALDAVATANPGLVTKFGGHAMAAGLTLAPDKFTDFQSAFDAVASQHAEALAMAGNIITDGELPEHCLSLEFADRLSAAGPWGQGFNEPLFHGQFTIAESRIVGEKHMKLTVMAPNNQQRIDAIAFNMVERCDLPKTGDLWQLTYRLEVNEYQGQRKVQLVVTYLELVE